jgi:hypothetical protein
VRGAHLQGNIPGKTGRPAGLLRRLVTYKMAPSPASRRGSIGDLCSRTAESADQDQCDRRWRAGANSHNRAFERDR